MFRKSWAEEVTGKIAWYKQARTYFYVTSIAMSFYGGQIYNAARQLESIGIPLDTSIVRDISRYEMTEPLPIEILSENISPDD